MTWGRNEVATWQRQQRARQQEAVFRRTDSPRGQVRVPGKESRRGTVAVIGLGYVGLPLSLEFARAGWQVIGLDIDPDKTQQLQAGGCYLSSVKAPDLKDLVDSGYFQPTTAFHCLRDAQAVILCVPTPLTETREPDLRYVVETARTVSRYLQPGQLVVLESTSYPGTTEEVVLPILQQSGLRCETNGAGESLEAGFYLAFSPERVDPGNIRYRLGEIPRLVAGVNPASAERARQLYQSVFEKVVVVSSPRVAEMAKLLENVYRAVNIALVNELKLICQPMGIDIWEVIEAAATKPYGFAPFYPGPGLGGHCIPVDPFYLAWKARAYDLTTRFIELAGEINSSMPCRVVERLVEALNNRDVRVRGSRILILGVAYKKDVDDIRESPALKIMQLLFERGACVAYNDPHVPRLHKTRRYDFSHLASVPLTPENLEGFDCVVVVTDHTAYNFHEIGSAARLILDTRNATRGIETCRAKVVHA
ncbi:MAG: nucleotide sugar dehydrogenase [Candidatus Acidiferrales bacterium]